MKTCPECQLTLPLEYFSKDKTKADGLQAKCKECMKAIITAWRLANPKRQKELTAAWYKINKPKVLEASANRDRGNRPSHRARVAAYRARRMQATPPWVNHSDLLAVYKEANELGLHVDHIIPLKHKLVCGLHVPWNLQKLTKAANSAKHNMLMES